MKAQGFSFIELMLTIAIVGVVAGMGMAVYGEYQKRAFNTTALQQGLQLRTAFEAALSDNTAISSTLFQSNRSFTFNLDGTTACTDCGGIDTAALFSAFTHQAGLKLIMSIGTNQSYTIQTGHCRALILDGAQYDGWVISDNQASYRVGFATDPDEIATCRDVLNS